MARTRAQKAFAREARRQRGTRSDRYRETTTEPSEDARMTVLSARCRHHGLPVTEANTIAMSAQMMGDPAGQAIRIGARDAAEAEAMWRTFIRLDRADEAYMRRIMHRSRHATCMKLEMLPDRFEVRVDDDSPADPRTVAEKDDDARRAWGHWARRIECLSWAEGQALWDGLRLRCHLATGGRLTGAGQTFVSALRLIHQMTQKA